MKAITVNILKPGGLSYSNGGISDRFDTALLLCEGGHIDPASHPELPVVQVVRRWVGSEPANYATVVHDPSEGDVEASVGPMMGGCYIASSDARYGRTAGIYGALPLHDRHETPDQYASST